MQLIRNYVQKSHEMRRILYGTRVVPVCTKQIILHTILKHLRERYTVHNIINDIIIVVKKNFKFKHFMVNLCYEKKNSTICSWRYIILWHKRLYQFSVKYF